MKVLIIEDGFEYSETLQRFLHDGFEWRRAGSGPQALTALKAEAAEAIYLDMRFDRAPPHELYGDVVAVADQFNGDTAQARQFIEDHQGTYILAELRAQGVDLPVLLSFDFASEPRRWESLVRRYGPMDFVPDSAGPGDVAARLRALAVNARGGGASR